MKIYQEYDCQLADFHENLPKVWLSLSRFSWNLPKVCHLADFHENLPNGLATGTTLQIGHTVAQLVEELTCKPEDRGFDSRWCHWNFPLTYSFRPHYGPGVDSASNRNEYQECFLGFKGGRCVGLTTLPPSCADCLEIWEPQPPEPWGPVQGLLFLY